MKLQERIPLNQIYKNSEQLYKNPEEEFSADLAEHLDALRVGQFEYPETEANVGARKADIVATGEDGTLVIECQLGKADWNHWGRLEAYARLKKADVAVLVAEEFEDLMIVTCRLRGEDSSIDWYLIEAQASSHGELSFHHAASPSIEILMEKKSSSVKSEFWAPIQSGDYGDLFKGIRRDNNRLVKMLDGMRLKVGVTMSESYAQIHFEDYMSEDQRAAIMKRLEDAGCEYKVNDRAAKSVRLNFPVLDIGWVDRDRWDEIREALVKKGEELYSIIEKSAVGPSKDIKTEKTAGGDESEFWAPVRRGEYGKLFAGTPVPRIHEGWIGKQIRSIGVHLYITNKRCYVLLNFAGTLTSEENITRRDTVMGLFSDQEYNFELSDPSAKLVTAKLPVLEKGKNDREDWDEIREKLVQKGEELFNAIKDSGV